MAAPSPTSISLSKLEAVKESKLMISAVESTIWTRDVKTVDDLVASLGNEVKRIGTKLLSEFITPAQAGLLIDNLSSFLETAEPDLSALFPVFLNTLTTQQVIAISNVFNELSKMRIHLTSRVDLEPLVVKFDTVLRNTIKNSTPNSYRLLNSILTQARVKTILVRIKSQFSASQWAVIKANLGPVILFSRYGL